LGRQQGGVGAQLLLLPSPRQRPCHRRPRLSPGSANRSRVDRAGVRARAVVAAFSGRHLSAIRWRAGRTTAVWFTVIKRNPLTTSVPLGCRCRGWHFITDLHFNRQGAALRAAPFDCQERKPASGKKWSGGGPRSPCGAVLPGAGWDAVARDGTVALWNWDGNPQDYRTTTPPLA